MTEQPQPEVTKIRVGDEQGRGGLYNMLVPGGFERAAVLLPIVGINPTAGSVFRLRDAWVEKDPDAGLVVHVYTRVGGGNREDYADIILALQHLPEYLRDADDSFDSTYASFWFKVPEGGSSAALADITAALADIAVDPVDTGQRWKDMLAQLEATRGPA